MTARVLALDRNGRGGRASSASDVRIVVLISGAHLLSHFLQLALPPLFPLLRDEFDVGYAALGTLMTFFYAASVSAR